MSRLLSYAPSQMLLELLRDRVDAQHGDRLTMAVLAAIIVPALLLEDDDLVAALVLDDGRADRGAGHERRAGGRAFAVTDHHDIAALDRPARLSAQLLAGDHVILGYSVLLSASPDFSTHMLKPST